MPEKTGSESWSPSVVDATELSALCDRWRNQGDTIAFTNGCFDVIHEGHLELFAAARARCNRLVIALNSDEWVASHKGAGRPLQSAAVRRAVAHCLGRADVTIVFEDETVERLLSIVKPNVYIIGSDYRDQKIIGAEHCGEVVITQRLPGVSTTASIAKASDAPTVQQHRQVNGLDHSSGTPAAT